MEAVALAFSIVFPIGDPETDLLNFPNAACVKHMLDFNGAYRDHINDARSFHGTTRQILWGNIGVGFNQVWNEPQWDWYTEALKEAWGLREIWNNLGYAHDAEHPMHKRWYLERLREVIGERDYRHGRMPPPIPTWRLPDYDQ